MKKCLVAFTFCFMFVIFGITSVFAATQTVVNDKNIVLNLVELGYTQQFQHHIKQQL